MADAALIFDGFYLTHEDDRERYDEQRFVSVGQAVNGVVVVIHTIVADDHIHLISARRQNPMKRVTTGKNTHGTAADDVPPLSKRQLAKLRPVMPVSKGKTRITIMIDDDVLAFFRDRAEHDGIGYQTLLNDMLRNGMAEREGTLEKTLRKIVREELRKAPIAA